MSSAADDKPAPSANKVGPLPTIELYMGFAAAQVAADWLGEHRGQPEAQLLQEALWLRAVLIKAQSGLSPYEKAVFRRRADLVLSRYAGRVAIEDGPR